MENETLMSPKEIVEMAESSLLWYDYLKACEDVEDWEYKKETRFLKSVIQLCKDWEGVFNG